VNLPNDEKAERAFLSVLLRNPALIRQYEGLVRTDDFYRHSHSLIFSALVRLSHEGKKAVDVISLVADLRDRGELAAAGGIIDITAIQQHAEPEQVGRKDSYLAHGYAEIITECARRREGYKVFASAAARAAYGEELENLLSLASEQLRDTAHEISGNMSNVQALTDLWAEWYAVTKERGEYTGIQSGLPLLDYMTGGWQDSTLIILGARPNMGKTALALNFAAEACKKGKRVAIFSLEMTKRELVSRILASEGNIDASHTNIPALLTDEENEKVDVVFGEISGWGLYVDDSYSLPMSQIVARSRRLQNADGLDMVIIDHLNYIGNDGKSENRTNEMRKITAALKGMAKELNIPVICLCQLSRGVESRNDKRPTLADLRESGTIEQDADIVLFLYRDGYYTKDEGDNSAELCVAKHRGGRVGTVHLLFDGAYQKFSPLPYSGTPQKAEMEDIPK